MVNEAPGYWMYETSGVLKPVVEKYLNGGTLDAQEIATMRAYLRQWMGKGRFRGVDHLTAQIDGIRTNADLNLWLMDAAEAGIDPL